ncbi:MAG: hypothetical protein JOZ16_05040 [Methylobacteriaceae bacterium]|nr:hypothetical protein [Methylobacteriaceae bacterium]
MPISFESGAVRLDPSLRVRLYQRNRLPELALTLSLATAGLFLAASFVAPASGNEGRFNAGSDAAQMIEMRSAATNETLIPARKDVRVINLDGSVAGGGATR